MNSKYLIAGVCAGVTGIIIGLVIFFFSIVGAQEVGTDQPIFSLKYWAAAFIVAGNLYTLYYCWRFFAVKRRQKLIIGINIWFAETKERLEVWRENHAFDLLRELAGDAAQGRISSVEFAELLLKRFPSRARLMRVAKINKGFALALIDTRLLLEDAVQQIDLLLAEKNIMIMREKLALMKPLKLEY